MNRACRCLLAFLVMTVPVSARAQDPAPAPAQPEARSTGLPPKLKWTFSFDAGWGNFGFQNSLFNNPKERR